MPVSVEDVSSVKKIMHIEVPREEVVRELDEAYADLKKNVKIKGFRKGKTPRSILERHYRKSVNAEITQKLIQQSLSDAIQEKQLAIVGAPHVEPPELDPKTSYSFKASIEIRPELQDLKFKGFELTKTLHEPSEGEVEAQLKMIQQTVSPKKPIEENRPIQESDFAVIDYEAYKDGEPLADIPKSENYTLKIGSGAIHQDLDSQIVGMEIGESKDISIAFPDDHPNETLIGANISLHVTLKEIRKQELVEIDDAFAKELGPFESLEDLKKRIMTDLETGYKKRIEQELNEQIFQALLVDNDFEVPDALVNAELDLMISDIHKKLEGDGKTMDEVGFTEEGLRETHRDTAIKQVKRYLLLGKLIEQEKMEISEEELDAGFEEMATTLEQPAQVMKKYYEMNPGQLDNFRHALLEKKAIKLIIENSSITEKMPDQEEVSE